MNDGMLWFDNDPLRGLDEKVQRAAAFFSKKYGRAADTCLVNPAVLDAEHKAGPVTVRPWHVIPPGHLWIGVDEIKRTVLAES